MLLAWGRGNGTKRKIVSNSPYEGEYARIRSNIVVRYQGSIHGLIFTHKNGPIFLTASKPSIGPATFSFMPMCCCPSPVHQSLSFGQFHAFVLAPSGITPASRKCQSATISLRARATIAIRRTRPAESPTRVRNHRDSLLSGWLRNQIQASSTATARGLRLPALLIPDHAPSRRCCRVSASSRHSSRLPGDS